MNRTAFWSVAGVAALAVAASLAAPRILNMTDQGQILFFEDSANGANKATIQAPASLAADYTLTLPPDDGTGTQFLATDGSGTLTWGSSSGVTLDGAYDGGSTVTVDTGTVALNGSIATNVLDVDQTGNGDALELSTSGTGYALHVDSGPSLFDGDAHFGGGVPWFDVQAFGAVGDGVADDTAEIAAAYAALDAAGGGVLYFPPGSYLMTSALVTSSDDVWIRGAGANESEIVTDGNDAIEVGDGASANFCDNFVISDIRLRESASADVTSIGIEWSSYVRYSRIERCRIQSFGGGGVLMRGGLNNRIDQCYISCGKAGTTGPNLYVTRSTGDLSFTTLLTANNYFASMGAAGVYNTLIEDGASWTSVCDIWENSAGVALRVQQSSASPTLNCSDHQLVGPHFEANTGNDVEIHDVARFCKFGGQGGSVVDTWSALAAASQNYYEVNGVTGVVEGLRKVVIANAFASNDISSTAGLQLGGIDGNELPELVMATESDTSGRTQRLRYFAETSGGSNVEIARETVVQGASDATAPLGRFQLSLTPQGGALATVLELTGAAGKTTLQLPQTASNVGLTVGGDTNLYRSAADTWTTDDSLTVTGTITANDFFVSNDFVTLAHSGVEIATGVITVTRSHHFVDTESDAATDDLDTIAGVSTNGTLLTLRAESDARTIVVKDNTGNLQLDGDLDFSLDNSLDRIVLMYDSANSVWVEIARNNNGT